MRLFEDGFKIAARLRTQTFCGNVGAADWGARVFARKGETDDVFDHQGLVGGGGARICLGEGVAVGGVVRRRPAALGRGFWRWTAVALSGGFWGGTAVALGWGARGGVFCVFIFIANRLQKGDGGLV